MNSAGTASSVDQTCPGKPGVFTALAKPTLATLRAVLPSASMLLSSRRLNKNSDKKKNSSKLNLEDFICSVCLSVVEIVKKKKLYQSQGLTYL